MHLRDFWHFILLLLPRIRTVLAGRTGKIQNSPLNTDILSFTNS